MQTGKPDGEIPMALAQDFLQIVVQVGQRSRFEELLARHVPDASRHGARTPPVSATDGGPQVGPAEDVGIHDPVRDLARQHVRNLLSRSGLQLQERFPASRRRRGE